MKIKFSKMLSAFSCHQNMIMPLTTAVYCLLQLNLKWSQKRVVGGGLDKEIFFYGKGLFCKKRDVLWRGIK